MKLGGWFRYVAVGLTMAALQDLAYGSDAVAVTPFVGETTRDFEARKRETGNGTPVRGKSLCVQGDRSGHFIVEPTLDGRGLRMLVDTGASVVTLSYED